MIASTTDRSSRTIMPVLLIALMVGEVVRVLLVTPRWLAGVPPAVAGQYQNRLLNALFGVSILGAVLVERGARGHTTRGRIAYWGLLGTACAIFALQFFTDR